MTPQQFYAAQLNANWYYFVHYGIPVFLIGLFVYWIVAYVNQTYYDN